MRKLSSTETELKKNVAYKKGVYSYWMDFLIIYKCMSTTVWDKGAVQFTSFMVMRQLAAISLLKHLHLKRLNMGWKKL